MPITHYSNYSMGNWMTEEEYNFLTEWNPFYESEKWYRNKMRTLRTEGSHLNKSFKMYKKLDSQIMRMDKQSFDDLNQLEHEIKNLQKQNKFLIFLVKKLRKK